MKHIPTFKTRLTCRYCGTTIMCRTEAQIERAIKGHELGKCLEDV